MITLTLYNFLIKSDLISKLIIEWNNNSNNK